MNVSRQTLLFPVLGAFLTLFCGFQYTASAEESSEVAARELFHKKYWDVVSTERLNALDILADSKEAQSHWILYTASFWDQEPSVRRKAFRMLSKALDKTGQLAVLCAQSFKFEKEISVRADKARMMAGLRFKWHALKELCSFVGGEPYPVLEYPYYGYDDYYVPRRRWIRIPGAGLAGRRGGGSGIGVVDTWGNHDEVRDRLRLFESFLWAINQLGGGEFKPGARAGKEIKKWWERKNVEFAEMDRRLLERIKQENADQARVPEAPKAVFPLMIKQLELDAAKKKESLDEEEDE